MQRYAPIIPLDVKNLTPLAPIKKSSIIIVIVLSFLAVPARMLAAIGASSTMPSPVAKLPYAKGQSFIVTQGYDTPPTHIKKDLYALDFTQNGCEAYGKAVVAAASGKVMFASQEGYDGGYGTELIIDHGNNIVSRYRSSGIHRAILSVHDYRRHRRDVNAHAAAAHAADQPRGTLRRVWHATGSLMVDFHRSRLAGEPSSLRDKLFDIHNAVGRRLDRLRSDPGGLREFVSDRHSCGG